MLSRRLLPVAIVSGIAALAVAAVMLIPSRASAQAEGPESLKGKPAPDFQLTGRDGKQVKLSDLKGNVVLLDFWATWCPPCRKSLPHIQHLSQDKQLLDKGLKIYAVNARETEAKVDPFMKDNKYTFNVLMDQDGGVLKSYQVRGIPTTVVVGRDGTVKNVFVGFGGDESAKQIDDAVNAALAEPK